MKFKTLLVSSAVSMCMFTATGAQANPVNSFNLGNGGHVYEAPQAAESINGNGFGGGGQYNSVNSTVSFIKPRVNRKA